MVAKQRQLLLDEEFAKVKFYRIEGTMASRQSANKGNFSCQGKDRDERVRLWYKSVHNREILVPGQIGKHPPLFLSSPNSQEVNKTVTGQELSVDIRRNIRSSRK